MPQLRSRWSSRRLALAFLLASGCAGPTEPRAQILTLDIASARVPCFGPFPMQCLQVRERLDEPWQLFYSEIAGFDFEPGYRYTVRIERREIPDPPMDVAGAAYRLLSVLSKAAD